MTRLDASLYLSGTVNGISQKNSKKRETRPTKQPSQSNMVANLTKASRSTRMPTHSSILVAPITSS